MLHKGSISQSAYAERTLGIQKIAQSENGTFSRCGGFEVESQPQKLKSFLKISSSIIILNPYLL